VTSFSCEQKGGREPQTFKVVQALSDAKEKAYSHRTRVGTVNESPSLRMWKALSRKGLSRGGDQYWGGRIIGVLGEGGLRIACCGARGAEHLNTFGKGGGEGGGPVLFSRSATLSRERIGK